MQNTEIVSCAITADNDGNTHPSGLKCEKNGCSKKWLIHRARRGLHEAEELREYFEQAGLGNK